MASKPQGRRLGNMTDLNGGCAMPQRSAELPTLFGREPKGSMNTVICNALFEPQDDKYNCTHHLVTCRMGGIPRPGRYEVS